MAVGGDLGEVIRKATRPEPQQRYGSAGELAEEIRRYERGLPVLAQAPTLSYRARRFLLRHKGKIAVAATVTVALAATTAAALWQARIAEREQRSAVRARLVAEKRQTEAEAARRVAEEQRSLAEANQKSADRQRDAAERRFQEVRKLANQVLFDYQGQLATMSVASTLRARMAADALQYLDVLARDRTSDPELQMEVARGYQEVAMVQGVPYRANLGDPEVARASLLKAKGILDGILSKRPDSQQARLERGWVLLRLSRVDFDNRTRLAGQCLKEWEMLHREAPQDTAITNGLAWAHLRLAELGARMEHGTRAIRYFNTLLQATPDDETVLGGAAYAHRIVAEGFRDVDQPRRTLEHALKSKELMERAIEYSRNPASRKIEYSFSIEYVGLGYRESGQYSESVKYFRESVRLREEVFQSNRDDQYVQQRLLAGYMHLGLALEKLSDAGPSEEWHKRIVDLIRQLSVRSTEDWSRTLGWIHSSSGIILKKAGRLAEACRSFELADQYFSDVKSQRGTDAGFASRLSFIRSRLSEPACNRSFPARAASNRD
jgi:tetratricopeptide (TPR) repeat protein